MQKREYDREDEVQGYTNRESSMWVRHYGYSGREQYTVCIWMSWSIAEESDEGNWNEIMSLNLI